jgi:hypothetical protein
VAIALLLAATGLHVYGEMVHSAGSWVIAYELAPADRWAERTRPAEVSAPADTEDTASETAPDNAGKPV